MKTNPQQMVTLYKIAAALSSAGHSDEFVEGVVGVASISQGCFELAELWAEAESQEDRDAVVADLQERIDELTSHNIVSLTKRDLKALKNARKKKPSEQTRQMFQEMKHLL